MILVIIGAPEHGKSTLIEAIKQQSSNIECKEIDAFKDLIESEKRREKLMEDAMKEFELKTIEDIKDETISIKRKKGKELKPWQRNKFYQK